VTESIPTVRKIVTDLGPPHKEAVVSQTFSTQHPAVVLRSRYQQLRALLVVAMIAVVGLTVAVVVLAVQDDPATGAGSATTVISSPALRSDGGPEESTIGGALGAQHPSGHPDESTVAHAIAGP
jgi:hypothetical protein